MDTRGEWIIWKCPECGEEHEDYEFTMTHCRKCLLVVTAIEGEAKSKNWYVRTDKSIFN